MMSLKRSKHKFVLFGFLLFAILGLFFINFIVQTSYSARLHVVTSPQQRCAKTKITETLEDSSNITDRTLLLTRISKDVLKFINKFQAEKISVNPIATAKPSAKSSIDIVNDYYPYVDFKFVFPEISPKVERTANIFMMVLVNSAAKGDEFRKRREAIRQTWGNRSNCDQRKASNDTKLKDLWWELVFVVGKAGPETNDDELNMAEAKKHNDMLIGNITDNYINNIVKFYMGQVWASRFNIKYTMKTDDDVYVRIPRVLEYLVNARLPKPFYGGHIFPSIRVNRAIGGKWTVSWKYFGEVNFPVFNLGAYFILSSDLLYRLFNYVYIRKPFHTDDAYVGVAMRDFGVKVTKVFSNPVQRSTNTFVHKAADCKILSFMGFGHDMSVESMKFLHERLKTLACGGKQIKC